MRGVTILGTYFSASGVALLTALTILLTHGCSEDNPGEPDASNDNGEVRDEVSQVDDPQFVDTSPDFEFDGTDPRACTVTGNPDLVGSYLVGIGTSLNRYEPFLFQLDISPGEGSYAVELQPLVHDGCPDAVACEGAFAREVVGEVATDLSAISDEDGAVRLSFGNLDVPSEANSATGTAMNVDIEVELRACHPQTLCGFAEITVNSLNGTRLNGTVAAAETTDISEAIVPENCALNPRTFVVCGDDECLPLETAAECPEDCDPNAADTGNHCATPFNLSAFADYASSSSVICYPPRDLGPSFATIGCEAVECLVETCTQIQWERVTECVHESFTSVVELNSACADCYAQFSTCQVAKCSPECINVPSSPGCLACLEDNECVAELTQCSGLPERYTPCE